MKRAVFIWFLAATIAFPAWALTPEQVKSVNTAIKETGISTHSVSFKEFLAKSAKSMPYELRRELENFSELSPKAQIPQATVTQIHEGKVEVIQLDFQVKNDHVTVQIRDHGDYALISGTQDGKKFEQRVGKYEMRNAGEFFSALTGGESIVKKSPTMQVLSADQIKLLTVKEKQNYINRFRDMMAAMEKAQNQFSKKADHAEFFWNLVADSAYAQQASGSCIVAGYIGEYRDNYCQPPTGASSLCKGPQGSGPCVVCNPEIYGNGEAGVGTDAGHLPSNATEVCNTKTESNKYAIFSGVQTKEQVSARVQSLTGMLQSLNQKCDEVDAGVNAGTKLFDQSDTCKNLRARVSDLLGAQCEILRQNPAQFSNLRCQVDVYQPDPRARNPGRPVASADDCVGLPSSQRELTCGASQVQIISCEEDGQVVKKYYCECADNENGVKPNTNLNTGCEAKKAVDDSITKRERKAKKEKPWYSQSWVIPAVAIVGILGLTWWGIHQQNELNASYYNSITTPVATPVPPPSSPLAPSPVNIIRSAPGVQ